MFYLHLKKTSSEDSEAELVQMFGKCMTKSTVTACNKHSFPLHLQRGPEYGKDFIISPTRDTKGEQKSNPYIH